MGVRTSQGILEAPLIKAAESNRITLLSAEPTSIVEVVSLALGSLAMTPGDGNGDYNILAGDVSGRKLRTLAQNIPVTVTGTGNHVALDDGTDFLVTTTQSKSWTNGDTAQATAFDLENPDPVAA